MENTKIATTMSVVPYLNTYYKEYQDIITFNKMPPGPLVERTTQINLPNLTEFTRQTPFYKNQCQYALLRYPKTQQSIKQPDYFMTADDIPDVLSYLIENGYTIQTELTNMIYKNNRTRNVVCIFTKL
jgi:hypothetical protein